jgi:hypothetical protein
VEVLAGQLRACLDKAQGMPMAEAAAETVNTSVNGTSNGWRAELGEKVSAWGARLEEAPDGWGDD